MKIQSIISCATGVYYTFDCIFLVYFRIFIGGVRFCRSKPTAPTAGVGAGRKSGIIIQLLSGPVNCFMRFSRMTAYIFSRAFIPSAAPSRSRQPFGG